MVNANSAKSAAEYIEPFRIELELLAASQMGLLLRQKVDPQDIAQEAIISAVANWDTFRGPLTIRFTLGLAKNDFDP